MIVYRTRTCNTSCNTIIPLTYTTITSFFISYLRIYVCLVGLYVSRARARTHLQTPVTLCREQSIRGYVSKESMFAGAGGVCSVRAN